MQGAQKKPKGSTIFPMIGRWFFVFFCLDDFARHVWPVDLPFTHLFLLTFTSLMSMLGDLDLSMFGIFRSLHIYIKKAPYFWNWHALEIINVQIASSTLGVDTYIFWGDLLKMHDNLNQPYLRYSFGTRSLTKKRALKIQVLDPPFPNRKLHGCPLMM